MRRNCQRLPLLTSLKRGSKDEPLDPPDPLSECRSLCRSATAGSRLLITPPLTRGAEGSAGASCRLKNYTPPPGHHQLQEELRTLLRVECPRASMVLAAYSRTGSPSLSGWISFIRLEHVNRTGRHCPRGACASAQCPSPNPAPAPQTRGSGSHRADSPRRTSARDRQPDR
jgi:hypothetical protein